MSVADLFYRGAQPKPVKGASHVARVRRRKADEAEERAHKVTARARDGFACRWPGCDCRARRDRLEVAHLVSKSRGGSNDTAKLVTLCRSRHQGRPSLHSGELRIEPLTAAGANGPLAFWSTDELGRWWMVAQERAVGIVERD